MRRFSGRVKGGAGRERGTPSAAASTTEVVAAAAAAAAAATGPAPAEGGALGGFLAGAGAGELQEGLGEPGATGMGDDGGAAGEEGGTKKKNNKKKKKKKKN